MIRGIIFDCFGVLYGSSAEIPRAMCPPELHGEFDDLVKQADYGFISGAEYVARCAELLGTSVDQLRDALYGQWVRNVPLAEYLQTLRPDYKVALLSNISTGTIDQLITREEQAQWFDTTVLSGEVHMTKPAPEIFTYTVEQLGLAPEECVMIDDRAENCEGASRAGLQVIRFASNDQAISELQRLLNEAK